MEAWARRQSATWSSETHVVSSSSVGRESSSSGPPPTTAYVTTERTDVDASWCSGSGVGSDAEPAGSQSWLAAAGDAAAAGGGGGASRRSSHRSGCSLSDMGRLELGRAQLSLWGAQSCAVGVELLRGTDQLYFRLTTVASTEHTCCRRRDAAGDDDCTWGTPHEVLSRSLRPPRTRAPCCKPCARRAKAPLPPLPLGKRGAACRSTRRLPTLQRAHESVGGLPDSPSPPKCASPRAHSSTP